MAILAHLFVLRGGCCKAMGCEGFNDSGFNIQRLQMDFIKAGLAALCLRDLWGWTKSVTKLPLVGQPWGRQQKDRTSAGSATLQAPCPRDQ